MHRRTRAALGASAAAVATFAATLAAPATASPAPGENREQITVEYFPGPRGHGRLTEAPVTSPTVQSARRARAADGEVHALSETGATGDRLDITVVGDGYRASEQGDFLDDARAKLDDVTALEPYRSYEGLFNVWAVEAASAESGVSGDPDKDTVRDTALGAYFWCADVERLVCVDLDKVAAYADKAPESDLVVVVVNSEKYGGAGYFGLSEYGYPFTGVSTLSSDNAQSSLIAAHEIGHSVGELTDEYTYPSSGTYTGPEPADANASTYTADQMLGRAAKWYRWLGADDPAGGVVGTYEGSGYYPFGLYRPTLNSIMRALNSTEFNLPGREAMIGGFYEYADALTSPVGTSEPVGRDERLIVELAALETGLSDLELRWYVDGRERRSARGDTTVVPRDLGVPNDRRPHTITAEVVDRTASIRDGAVRELATESLSWQVGRTG